MNGRCALCGLDHEWAPDWTIDGCPMPVRGGLSPKERVRDTMKALKVATSQEAFEAFLSAQFEAAQP